jgi:hypothetical protein
MNTHPGTPISSFGDAQDLFFAMTLVIVCCLSCFQAHVGLASQLLLLIVIDLPEHGSMLPRMEVFRIGQAQ